MVPTVHYVCRLDNSTGLIISLPKYEFLLYKILLSVINSKTVNINSLIVI